MLDQQNPIVMEEVTDPQEIAETRARRERFDRNSAWLQTQLGVRLQRGSLPSVNPR